MSPDRDPRFPPADEPDEDFEEEDAPRSIFSAAWFRVVLVLLGVAVVGAVAVPYVLDAVKPPESSAPPIITTPAPSPTAPAPGATARPATPPESAAPTAPEAPATAPPAKAPAETAPAAVAQAPKPAPEKPAPKEPTAGAPKSAPAPKAAAPAGKVAAARPAAPARAKASEGGDYFVQVGAFKDQDTAKRVAARLRDQNYPVDESVKRVAGGTLPAPRPAPRAGAVPDRYDVIVSGGSATEIDTKLAAKGLASEPAGEGVRIRPSLPLRDAVALSKDLGSEGFKVQVRRGGTATASAEPAPPATGGEAGAQTLYRVRVGGYPDRATARSVQRELQEKGFQPFVAKGRE